jgi:hypothetical protein
MFACEPCAADPSNLTPRVAKETDTRVGVNIVEVDGLHR